MDRRLCLWVFLFFSVLYVGTTRGRFISTDEVVTYEATASLWADGVPAVQTSENVAVAGRGGRQYSTVNSGQSILALPLYGVGRLADRLLSGSRWRAIVCGPTIERHGLIWSGEVEIFFVGLFNGFVTAALCALFMAFSLRLGAAPRPALLSTLLLGTTSYIVGYASTFFTQPIEAVGLLGAFYFLYADRLSPDWRPRAKAGALVALTVGCRYPALIVVPGLAAYAAWVGWERGRIRGLLSGLAWLLGGAVCGLALHVVDQLWKFGTVASQGGYAHAHWDGSLLTGVSGLLFSPGDSIFIYSPLLLLAPAWFVPFARRHSAETAFIVGQTVLSLVIFGRFNNWHGLWCFGPRYMMTLVPLLMLPLGGWLQDCGRRAAPWVAPLALAGLWVQAVHLLANFWSMYTADGYLGIIDSYPRAAGSAIPGAFLFVPRLSPLLSQSRDVLAMNGVVDMWPVRVYRSMGMEALLSLLVPWTLALGALAWMAWRGATPIEAAEPRCPGGLWGTALLAAILGGFILLAPAPPRAPSPPPIDIEGELMKRGLDLLYQMHNPSAAVTVFREVLSRNPRHYGANFQLARALDGAGRTEEARAQWKRVLSMAEEAHDEASAREARERLNPPGNL